METTDRFGPGVAEHYDSDDDVRFTPEHLALESGFLAALGGRALEFAVGTGRIALPLRARGVEVHGIDLSAAMVAQLRAKPGGADLPVVVGDYTSTRVPGEFDLVYLVYNTIGNVTTQDAQVATFANAARHLRPGGCFVVETGVPQVRPGERFRVFRHDARGVGYDEYDVDDPAAQRMWSHHVTDGVRRSIPFRYVWPAELDLMARLAGMRLRERWGWWDRSAFTGRSASHVSVWEAVREPVRERHS
ncbi:class I SAM-dependent DNA methyltransferase [Pseudonocardia pini]|uniref:class I SAM-dependent DNA methyltransferase n=1 Tax=Pseudonocardia pini TaxID=2758030 RepID=UPI0015F11B60|nr:class I SAM-dependent methyltransferase [Pseudonocardia pini]